MEKVKVRKLLIFASLEVKQYISSRKEDESVKNFMSTRFKTRQDLNRLQPRRTVRGGRVEAHAIS